MAITSSAKKAIRVSARKRVFNLIRKRKMDDMVKKLRRLVSVNKIEEAKILIPAAYKVIDKAAKGNYIKKNTASRIKSRLTTLVNKPPAK